MVPKVQGVAHLKHCLHANRHYIHRQSEIPIRLFLPIVAFKFIMNQELHSNSKSNLLLISNNL